MIITIASPCYAFNPTFKPQYIQENGKFLAYYTLNAATITLANGQIISSAKVIGGSQNESKEIVKAVDIVFIIDNSGSMSGTNMNAVKNALKGKNDNDKDNLIETIYSQLPNSRIALITFQSAKKAEIKTDFVDKEKKNELKTQIDGMVASGGTVLSEGLEKVSKLSFRDDAIKAIITLTDGEPNPSSDGPKCPPQYRKFLQEGYLLYNIALGGNYTSFFKDKEGTIGEIFTKIEPTDLSKIYNDIFQAIREVIINSSIDETFTLDCENAIVLDDMAQFTLDYELAQSALLTVEYLIDIKPIVNCTSITITDTMRNFSYDPDSKLLTDSNRTNSDEKWKSTDNSSVLEFHLDKDGNEGKYPIPKNEDFQKKIVLTKIININSADYNKCNNSVDFSIEWENAKGEKTTSKDKFNSTVCVIPPLGATDNYNVKKLLYVLVTSVIIINIILVTKRKKQKRF